MVDGIAASEIEGHDDALERIVVIWKANYRQPNTYTQRSFPVFEALARPG
jgi:hypothetical protein